MRQQNGRRKPPLFFLAVRPVQSTALRLLYHKPFIFYLKFIIFISLFSIKFFKRDGLAAIAKPSTRTKKLPFIHCFQGTASIQLLFQPLLAFHSQNNFKYFYKHEVKRYVLSLYKCTAYERMVRTELL